jgi:hypothetical protein
MRYVLNSRVLIPVLVFGVISAYALFELRNTFTGPQLVIETPSSPTEDIMVTIHGHSTRAQTIQVNGLHIVLTPSGDFEHVAALAEGNNAFTFTATDKFGNTDADVVHVWHNVPASPSITETVTPDDSLSAPANEDAAHPTSVDTGKMESTIQ